MSVQAQIDRISSNVTAAIAKIAEKGVTVPSMANSDDLAELIAAIEAGGSGGVDLYPFESYFAGYYTPAANYTTFDWNDLFGIEKTWRPAIFFISASPDLGNSPTFDTKTVIGAIAAKTYNGLAILNYNKYGNTTTSYPSFSNSTKALFGSYYLKAGNTYKYCLIW